MPSFPLSLCSHVTSSARSVLSTWFHLTTWPPCPLALLPLVIPLSHQLFFFFPGHWKSNILYILYIYCQSSSPPPLETIDPVGQKLGDACLFCSRRHHKHLEPELACRQAVYILWLLWLETWIPHVQGESCRGKSTCKGLKVPVAVSGEWRSREWDWQAGPGSWKSLGQDEGFGFQLFGRKSLWRMFFSGKQQG